MRAQLRLAQMAIELGKAENKGETYDSGLLEMQKKLFKLADHKIHDAKALADADCLVGILDPLIKNRAGKKPPDGEQDSFLEDEFLLATVLQHRGLLRALQDQPEQALADLNRSVALLDQIVNQQGHSAFAEELTRSARYRSEVLAGNRPRPISGHPGKPGLFRIRRSLGEAGS